AVGAQQRARGQEAQHRADAQAAEQRHDDPRGREEDQDVLVVVDGEALRHGPACPLARRGASTQSQLHERKFRLTDASVRAILRHAKPSGSQGDKIIMRTKLLAGAALAAGLIMAAQAQAAPVPAPDSDWQSLLAADGPASEEAVKGAPTGTW